MSFTIGKIAVGSYRGFPTSVLAARLFDGGGGWGPSSMMLGRFLKIGLSDRSSGTSRVG